MNKPNNYMTDMDGVLLKGKTMIPGPAGYSRVVERALDAGVYAFPCDDVGVEPADRNRWCGPAR